MMCRKPFVPAAGPAYGCGQCMPCRYNRRRIWKHRIILEAALHESNSFVTLTYDDEHIPADGSLDPAHVRDWLKRLRKAVSPSRFRFFLVGEYGDTTQRPHYHAGLFGFPSCIYGQSTYSGNRKSCCHWCDLVRKTWGKGNIYVGTLEPDSAQYLAGYVTKKMTAKDDPRLFGRHPEFGRMSLRPGIGHDAMYDLSSVLLQFNRETDADVPTSLAHGRKLLPLGRYLRSRLRVMIGKDGKISQEAMDELSQEMRVLRLAARNDKENPSVASHIMLANEGKYNSFEAKSRIFKKEKRL